MPSHVIQECLSSLESDQRSFWNYKCAFVLPFFGEIHSDDFYQPNFRLQAIFIGKYGAYVRNIKEACGTGDPFDPNIEL